MLSTYFCGTAFAPTEMKRGPRSPLAKLDVHSDMPFLPPTMLRTRVWLLGSREEAVRLRFNVVFGVLNAWAQVWS